MRNTGIEKGGEQAVYEGNAEEFRHWLRGKARQALYALVEQEVEELCGKAHLRENPQSNYRSGSAPSSAYIDGEKEALPRPRVRRRSEEGSLEVLLKSWQLAKDPEAWEAAMMRAVLCGVSTRNIARLRPTEIAGESKSNLSRLWQRKAGELAREQNESSLEGIDLLVLMLDGVVLCKDLVATVALGIDAKGSKHILGYRVGSSENQEVCEDLLVSLKQRGLQAPKGRRLLAILDGSHALKNALLKEFPGSLVQRCLVHKERNLRGYLPKKHWKELALLFKRLRQAQGAEAALDAAGAIEKFLQNKNAQARESFAEAGEDLLRLQRLNVPNTLHVSLLSTNGIENAFKNLRRHIGRVCRWRYETQQADLWLSSGLALAARGFRNIRGYQDLPALVKALELEEARIA